MKPFPPWSPRRLIAVDPGVRCVKLLLAESNGDRVSVLHHKLVELQEEGLLAPEEIRRHLATIIRQWGEWPLAVALAPESSFSQVVDLKGAGEEDIPRVIEEQTGRLRDFSRSPLVHEVWPLHPHGTLQQPYFITIAREEDVSLHFRRITEQDRDVRAVSGFANALLSARRQLQPGIRDGVLVDFGAGVTAVVIVRDGEGVYASSFATGSNTLVDALAAAQQIGASEAENQLRTTNLFTGNQTSAAAGEALDRWLAQLHALVEDWRRQNADWLPDDQPVPLLLSGGVAHLPGLTDRLRTEPGFQFVDWPEFSSRGESVPMADFALAYGTVVEAFRRAPDAPSLLPPLLREHGQNLRKTAWVNAACAAFLMLTAFLLSAATWHKLSLASRKQALIRQATNSLSKVQHLENLAQERDRLFEEAWPLINQQEFTLDLLRTTQVLQEARAKNDFWCVLLADSESYARGITLPIPDTNRFSPTDVIPSPEESTVRSSFVTELCVPATGEQTLKVLNDVVGELRKYPLFSRVDSLPAAQRRALVDPKVLIPDRHFALSIDLTEPSWRQWYQTNRLADVRQGTNVIRHPNLPVAPRVRFIPVLPSTSAPPARTNE